MRGPDSGKYIPKIKFRSKFRSQIQVRKKQRARVRSRCAFRQTPSLGAHVPPGTMPVRGAFDVTFDVLMAGLQSAALCPSRDADLISAFCLDAMERDDESRGLGIRRQAWGFDTFPRQQMDGLFRFEQEEIEELMEELDFPRHWITPSGSPLHRRGGDALVPPTVVVSLQAFESHQRGVQRADRGPQRALQHGWLVGVRESLPASSPDWARQVGSPRSSC